MKKTYYNVWFSNANYTPEKVVVCALNAEDAVILAKAKRIKQGLDKTLYSIEKR